MFASDNKPSLLHSCTNRLKQSQLQTHKKIYIINHKATRTITVLGQQRSHIFTEMVVFHLSYSLFWDSAGTYLHLWSALSSSGVSFRRYSKATFTSSAKSWQTHTRECRSNHVYTWMERNMMCMCKTCPCTWVFSPCGYFFSLSKTWGIWKT